MKKKFGVVAAVIEDARWGTSLNIIYCDGSTTNLNVSQFSDKYLGHGETRFVTRAVYDAYQDEKAAEIKARYAE